MSKGNPSSLLSKFANLDKVKASAQEAAKNKQDDAHNKETDYTLDERVVVDSHLFEEALAEYVDKLKDANKTILAVALQKPRYFFNYNMLRLTLTNQLLPDLIAREQELLPFLRKKLQVPNLFLEIEIDASYVDPQDEKPYTDEEKLVAMRKKNPAIEALQAAFKTRIVYD